MSVKSVGCTEVLTNQKLSQVLLCLYCSFALLTGFGFYRLDSIWTKKGGNCWAISPVGLDQSALLLLLPIKVAYFLSQSCVKHSIYTQKTKGLPGEGRYGGLPGFGKDFSWNSCDRFPSWNPNTSLWQRDIASAKGSLDYNILMITSLLLLYSGDKLGTLWCIQGKACFFHTTSSSTFNNEQEHTHPNLQQCAVKRGHSNAITDITNSAKRKSKTLPLCRPRTDTPPHLRHTLYTSSITYRWFQQSLIHSRPHLIFITEATWETAPLIKYTRERESSHPGKQRHELKWLLQFLCSASSLHPSCLTWSTHHIKRQRGVVFQGRGAVV